MTVFFMTSVILLDCRRELSKIRQKSLVLSTVEAIVSRSSLIAVFLSVLFLALGYGQLTPTKRLHAAFVYKYLESLSLSSLRQRATNNSRSDSIAQKNRGIPPFGRIAFVPQCSGFSYFRE